jgi:hypothetical protein
MSAIPGIFGWDCRCHRAATSERGGHHRERIVISMAGRQARSFVNGLHAMGSSHIKPRISGFNHSGHPVIDATKEDNHARSPAWYLDAVFAD